MDNNAEVVSTKQIKAFRDGEEKFLSFSGIENKIERGARKRADADPECE